MPQPHRSLTALPAVAAAAAALVSGCASPGPTPQVQPSISVGSEATTPGIVGQGTPDPPAANPTHTESSTAPLPAEGEPVVFEHNIKPLFREDDRESMKFAFDLWSYTDVKSQAKAIVQRLRDGSMPCDTAWSAEKINVFQRWIDSGMAP